MTKLMRRYLLPNESQKLSELLAGAYACEREAILKNFLRDHNIVLFRDEMSEIRFQYDMQELEDELPPLTEDA